MKSGERKNWKRNSLNETKEYFLLAGMISFIFVLLVSEPTTTLVFDTIPGHFFSEKEIIVTTLDSFLGTGNSITGASVEIVTENNPSNIISPTGYIIPTVLQSTCANLTARGVYTLTQNIVADTHCFIINGSDIFLNGSGYSLISNGSGVGINITGFNNITIFNLTIYNFSQQIYVQDSNGTNITNVTFLSRITNTQALISLQNVNHTTIVNNYFEQNTSSMTLNTNILFLNTDLNITNNYVNRTNNSNQGGFNLGNITGLNFNSNTLFDFGSGGTAILLMGVTNSNFSSNKVYVGGGSLSTAFGFQGMGVVENNTFTNDNITSFGTQSAVFLNSFSQGECSGGDCVRNNYFINVNISTNGSQEIQDNSATNVSNYLIYNNSFGEIKWIDNGTRSFTRNLTLSVASSEGIGLARNLFIGSNVIALNTSTFGSSWINGTANITVFGLNFTAINSILKVPAYDTNSTNISNNGVDCLGSSCTVFSMGADSTLRFNTTSFSSFAALGNGSSICGTVNGNLTLTQNTTFTGTCLTINASNILINGAGYVLTGTGSGFGINSSGFRNITIRNIALNNFSEGIHITAGFNITISNVTIETAAGDGERPGIVFQDTNSSVINTSTLTINATNSHGILLNFSEGNILLSNTLFSIGNGSTGLGLRTSNYNNVSSNIINTTGSGPNLAINLVNGSYNLFDYNSLNSSKSTVLSILSTSENNTFLNNNFTSNNTEISDSSSAGLVNYLIYNNTFGEIRWTNTSFQQDLTLNANNSLGIGLGRNIFIGQNIITVNTSAFVSGRINSSANLTLYALNVSRVESIRRLEEYDENSTTVIRAGTDCISSNSCLVFNYNVNTGILRFNTTSFSSFAADIASCGYVNRNFTLNQNVSAENTCFIINASNIFINCTGNVIRYGSSSAEGKGVNNTGFHNVTIKNCLMVEQADTSSNKDAIWWDSALDGVLFNNTLSTIANASASIELRNFANRTNISQNYMNTSGTIAPGLYMLNTRGGIIASNTIIGWNSYGLLLINNSNNSFIANNITGNSTLATIEISDVSTYNNTFRNNTINAVVNFSIYDLSGLETNNTLIYNNSFGMINWTRENLTTNMSLVLGQTIFLQQNLTGILDTAQSLNLNRSARIDIKNLTYSTQPFLLKDGVRCDNDNTLCTIASYDSTTGILTATVASFSNYSATSGSNVTQCGTINNDVTINNNISTDGTCFIVNASNILIEGAGFTITGDGSGSAVLAIGFNNLTVRNLIAVNFSTVIDVRDSVNHTIWNNTIISGNASTGSIGISFSSANRSNISRNNVTTFTNSSPGIRSLTSTLLVIDSNKVVTSGNNSYGLDIAVSSNRLQSNTVITSGLGAVGILINPGERNNTIIFNNVNTTGNAAEGILAQHALSHNISFNRIVTTNSSSLYFVNSSFSIVDFNNITSLGDGIALDFNFITTTGESSSDNNISSNIIRGLVNLGQNASRNTLVENNFTTDTVRSIIIQASAANNTLRNNNISSASTSEIDDQSGNSNLNSFVYNNSFGKIQWTNNSFLDDLDLQVGNALGIGLERSFFIRNNSVTINTSAFTSGRINSSANLTLVGLGFNSVANIQRLETFSTNIDEIKTGGEYCNGTSCLILSFDNASQVLLFNMTSFGSFTAVTADNSSPTISLLSPPNNTLNNTNSTPRFAFNVTDDLAQQGTLDCTLYLNNSEGVTAPYGRNSSTRNATATSITANASLLNGEYHWSINCSDGGTSAVSETRNLTISNFCGRVTASFTLNHDLSSTGDCFIINNSNLFINGSGHSVYSNGSGTGVTINGFNNITLFNFTLNNFTTNIRVQNSNGTNITNMTLVTRTRSGLDLLFVQNSNHTTIANNFFELNSSGTAINTNISFQSKSFNITGNYVNRTNNSNQGGIILRNVSGGIFFSNTLIDFAAFGSTVLIAGVDTMNFSSNRFYSGGGSLGISYDLQGQGVVENNTFTDENITHFGTSSALFLNSFSLGDCTSGDCIRNNYFVNINISSNGSVEISDDSAANVSNYLIYNNSFGGIEWIDNGTGSFLRDLTLDVNNSNGIGVGRNIFIGNNTLAVNTSAFTSGRINSSANITLRGLGFSEVVNIRRLETFNTNANEIRTSGTNCNGTSCTIFSFDNVSQVLLFNTTSFSSFAALDTLCGSVNSSVTLTRNITSSGTCFTVLRSNIIIDGAGYAIIGNGVGLGVNISDVNNVTVKNIFISNFSLGVFESNTNNVTVSNSTFTTNTQGISVDNTSKSIITDTVLHSNVAWAIQIFNSSQANLTGNLIYEEGVQAVLLNLSNHSYLESNIINDSSRISSIISFRSSYSPLTYNGVIYNGSLRYTGGGGSVNVSADNTTIIMADGSNNFNLILGFLNSSSGSTPSNQTIFLRKDSADTNGLTNCSNVVTNLPGSICDFYITNALIANGNSSNYIDNLTALFNSSFNVSSGYTYPLSLQVRETRNITSGVAVENSCNNTFVDNQFENTTLLFTGSACAQTMKYNNSFGSVQWTNISNISLPFELGHGKNLIIADNFFAFNTSAFVGLNRTGTIILQGLTFSSVTGVTKDPLFRSSASEISGSDCLGSGCTLISYSSGTLTFNTSSFSSFTASETITTESEAVTGGGGGGGGASKPKVECTTDADCEADQYCFNNQCIEYECITDDQCSTDEVCIQHSCVKLFDLRILDVTSPVPAGENIMVRYLMKAVSNISGDVVLDFTLEKEGVIKTEGKDVIFIQSGREEIENATLFVPSDLEPGQYTLTIELTYGDYHITSHRQIEVMAAAPLPVVVAPEVVPPKARALVGGAFFQQFKGRALQYSSYWVGLIALLIFLPLLFLTSILMREEYRKYKAFIQTRERKKEVEKTAPSISVTLPSAWGKKQQVELQEEYDQINKNLKSLEYQPEAGTVVPPKPPFGMLRAGQLPPEFLPPASHENISSRVDSLERKRFLNRKLGQIEETIAGLGPADSARKAKEAERISRPKSSLSESVSLKKRLLQVEGELEKLNKELGKEKQ